MDKEIIDLFKDFINNRCNSQELDRVLTYIKEGKYLSEWDSAIEEEANVAMGETNVELMSDLQKKSLNHRIDKQIRKAKFNPLWWKYAAAAVVLVALGISMVLYKGIENSNELSVEIVMVRDVVPGGDVATLTLADGTTIELDDKENGNVAIQGNTAIVKEGDGELVYQSVAITNEKPIYNTLSTPRGGQYRVVLPDGTKVWLNASSSIVYPTAFTESKRTVQIKGEAYFEVTPNKDKPFIVSTAGQSIEVLGTHFNVNAYEDEEIIRTTLVEGSVRVAALTASSILVPGEQSLVYKGRNQIILQKVDTETAVGWKNGNIHFNNADLVGVLKQLSRWYDVDVDLKGVPYKKLIGIVSRNVNLSVVLKAIEKTSNVKLKIEQLPNGAGRRIVME